MRSAHTQHSRTHASREARQALLSPHGDAFTLMAIFEEWLHVKQERGGGGASAKVGVVRALGLCVCGGGVLVPL